MGLFGFIGKAVGKVAKAGLSVATRGVSDKVLAVLKSSTQGKKLKVGMTRADQLLAAKYSPSVRTTESGSHTLLKSAAAGGHKFGTYSQKDPPATNERPGKRRPRNRPATAGASSARAKPRRSPARARSAPKRALVAKPKGRRAPPTGGLDLKGLSQSWRAAGKPGSWQGWIKANK